MITWHITGKKHYACLCDLMNEDVTIYLWLYNTFYQDNLLKSTTNILVLTFGQTRKIIIIIWSYFRLVQSKLHKTFPGKYWRQKQEHKHKKNITAMYHRIVVIKTRTSNKILKYLVCTLERFMKPFHRFGIIHNQNTHVHTVLVCVKTVSVLSPFL